ncbi:MAG: hypothetical protein WC501_00325 [Candidatus Micrarchaeia archaeon]
MFKSDLKRKIPTTKQVHAGRGTRRVEKSGDVFRLMKTMREDIQETRDKLMNKWMARLKGSQKMRKQIIPVLTNMIMRGDTDILDRMVTELKENKNVTIRKSCVVILATVLDKSSNIHNKVIDGLKAGLNDDNQRVREICKNQLENMKM